MIPDLTPSPSSTIDAGGFVRCLVCKRAVRFRDADLVGLGWRCPACTRVAALDGADDEAVHLEPDERARVRREPSARAYAVSGALFGTIAAIQWATHWDIRWGVHRPGSLFVYMFIATIGCFSLAWFRWRER